MRTPFPPPSDRLQTFRVCLAIVLTGSAFLASGSLAVRLYSLTKVYQQQRTDQMHQAMLSRIEYLKAAQDHAGCIVEAEQIPAESLFYSRATILRDQCQNALTAAVISRAQTKAAAGQLKDAISEIQTVSNSAETTQVQQFVWEWSSQILQIAEGYYLDPNGRLQDAIRTASAITPSNPLYEQAQTKIRSWQQEWLTNQSRWQAAQSAFKARQYETALLQAQQITHPYWSQQAAAIVQAVYAEQAAAEQAAAEQSSQSKPDSELDSAQAEQEMDYLISSITLLLPLLAGIMFASALCRHK